MSIEFEKKHYVPISANTLFHFTNSMDNLIEILKCGFKPKYCLENFQIFEIGEKAVPMTCFCDIPLSQIRNHISVYGTYAIGLSKAWGQRRGISPVLYISSEFETAKILKENLRILKRDDPRKVMKHVYETFANQEQNYLGALLIETIGRLSGLISYIKPYEGKFWRNGGYLGYDVRFYDEREWRYVPQLEETISKQVPSLIEKDQYLNKKNIEKANAELQANFNLNFSFDDIRYIIVENEKEVLSIIDEISKINTDQNHSSLEMLKTKLISLEKILEDF